MLDESGGLSNLFALAAATLSVGNIPHQCEQVATPHSKCALSWVHVVEDKATYHFASSVLML